MFNQKPKARKQNREPESQLKPRRGRPYALKAVIGNLTMTRTSVVAWFTLTPQSVSFRLDSDIESLIASGGAALADLVGHRIYWRVTTRPISVFEIADRTWNDAVVNTAGPLPGASDMLIREQGRLASADLTDKFVFLGIRLTSTRRYPSDPRKEAEKLRPLREKVAQTVAQPGLSARISTLGEMDLLLRRSFGLSLPLPDPKTHVLANWSTDDLPALTSDVLLTAEPWAKTAEISSWDDRGNQVQNHIAVLTMGRIGDMEIPQDGQGGWMHRTDRLPFPVEWMATVDILPDDKVAGQIRHQIDVIIDQHKHYTVEHGKPAPRSLERQNSLALDVEEELSAGLGGLATRTEGWYRLAVWGDDPREVSEKVAAVQGLYGRQIEWWWSPAQYEMVREFVPGEPLANQSERRRLNTPSVMAALPSATAQIGDDYGILLGETGGTSVRPCLVAPWADMEKRNRSGLWILTGSLGSGKSVTGGLIVYKSVMLGARWTIFDPSGQLSRLCELPELREYSQHTNLLAGRSGELSPYRVLRDPVRSNYQDRSKSDIANRQDFVEAVSEVEAQRQSVCLDTLTALLPKRLKLNDRAMSVLGAAVSAVPGKRDSNPVQVLEHLARIASDEDDAEWTAEHRISARDVLAELERFSKTPKGRLVFGTAPDDDDPDKRILLQVYSLHGLQVPSVQQIDRGDDSSNARQSMALFNLAAWLTQQSIYLGDRHERKGLFIDEAHLLSRFEEGNSLIEKSSVDSRKHNTLVLLCSQNVNHFDIKRIGPLCSTVIVGRTTDKDAAKDALELANLPDDDGYKAILGSLTQEPPRVDPDEPKVNVPHEFLLSTKELGTREIITVYGDEHPHVMAALNTTPGQILTFDEEVPDEEEAIEMAG